MKKEKKIVCLHVRFIGAVKDMSDQIVTPHLRVNFQSDLIDFFTVQKDVH